MPDPTNTDTASTTSLSRGERLRAMIARRAFVWSVLGVITIVTHGWSLNDASFLDDHWHQMRLRQMGWSVGELLSATTLEPSRFMDMWWQDRVAVWKYSRPFSVLVMKAIHEVTGGSLFALHALSLVLHFIAACGVYRLCRHLTENAVWSLIGGLMFVVYAHSVFAVSWLAAQNAVLQTTLMLWALLLYVRASGLKLHAAPSGTTDSVEAEAERPRLRIRLFVAVVVLWLLSLFARENAIMLPPILLALDLTFGGWKHLRRRVGAYVVFGSLSVAFLIWRMFYFYAPMPGVYFRGADGDGYLLWCVAKLMHYLCSAVWLSPMTVGPSGRYHPFQEVPGDCLLMAAVLAVMAVGYYQASRRAPGFWIWPLWILLSVLPVVPVLATPHSGYLCGVGFAVALVLPCGLRNQIHPVGLGRLCRPAAIWFLIASSAYMPIYRTVWDSIRAAETLTMMALEDDAPPEGVTDIFFLDLPFVNIYADVQLREMWGDAMDGVRCHALTFSPNLLEMKQESHLTQLDDHRFTIAVQGRPYFSGLLGRFLVEGLRSSGPFEEGQRIHADGFDVQILKADAEGASEILFEFPKPLASPDYRFYVSSVACGAWRMAFDRETAVPASSRPVDALALSAHNVSDAADRLRSGDADAAGLLFRTMRHGDSELKQTAWRAVSDVGHSVSRAMAAPCQDQLERYRMPAEWPAVERWWNRYVDNDVLDRLWVSRDNFVYIRWMRDGIARGRRNTSNVIQTDMYLTGPPFPGPRPDYRRGNLVGRQ